MNIIKTKQFFVFLSLLCAIGVFLMSSAFQSMAYWGNDLTWYWVGVALTYFLWLMGIVFLVVAITRKANVKGKLIFGLSMLGIAIFILLICGFLWTTFVIIAGMSGMWFFQLSDALAEQDIYGIEYFTIQLAFLIFAISLLIAVFFRWKWFLGGIDYGVRMVPLTTNLLHRGVSFVEMNLMLIASVISAVIAISIKNKRGKMQPAKIMILGVAIMLISIYIQNEVAFNYHGYEIYILVFGFILTLAGLFMKDKSNEK